MKKQVSHLSSSTIKTCEIHIIQSQCGLDYDLWSLLESKAGSNGHYNLESLKQCIYDWQ